MDSSACSILYFMQLTTPSIRIVRLVQLLKACPLHASVENKRLENCSAWFSRRKSTAKDAATGTHLRPKPYNPQSTRVSKRYEYSGKAPNSVPDPCSVGNLERHFPSCTAYQHDRYNLPALSVLPVHKCLNWLYRITFARRCDAHKGWLFLYTEHPQSTSRWVRSQLFN